MLRAAREARNAAKLRDHPHIVAVHDVVVEDGTPWIVMRLVEGRSLAELLRTDGPLPAPRAAEVTAALLKALKAAHTAGIVHRDKPANVLLTDDGQVLLTDFGIAVHETDTRLTTTGGVIGSVEYMAPERFRGAQDQAAGDLFSLGVTLYEAVEGISPFRRETPTATIAAIALHDPPPMRHAGPVLASLITALPAKNPDGRPTVDSTLAVLRAGTPMITAVPLMPSHSPRPSTMTAAPTGTTAPVSRMARAGRLITGSCFLVIGLGLVAFGSSPMIVRDDPMALIGPPIVAALAAVFLGPAAMLFRWKGYGRP
ncbi:serine/threonine-protein kinase, partial [Streptomyces sp. NRRL S-495]|uniref:serine/threonine-protein kinase n=1 Tax=Streptomyces sp. NRRL S-495 TaxID=1609133 RepID=UPI0013318A13